MKKYIVKQVYNDDTSIYWDDVASDIEWNYTSDIMIGFNRDYKSYNFDIIECIDKNIIDASKYDISVYYKNNYASYIIDYLSPYKKISVKQALEIIKAIKNIDSYNRNKRFELIAAILSIIFSKKFSYITLKGYCQNDWIYCFYSDKIDYEYIQYIEAVFFGTGIELYISKEKIKSNEIDDISAFEYDGYCEYIVDYIRTSDLLSKISDLIGCDRDEIELFVIASVRTRQIYEIEYQKN